jgi:hypothetical protein
MYRMRLVMSKSYVVLALQCLGACKTSGIEWVNGAQLIVRYRRALITGSVFKNEGFFVIILYIYIYIYKFHTFIDGIIFEI